MFIGEILVIVSIIAVVTQAARLYPTLDTPSNVIFQVAVDYLPLAFGALVMCACMAFIVTTADSYLLSSATNLTNDVYERYIRKATDKQKMLVLRGTIIVFSFVAVALTLYFPTVLSLQMTAYTMYGAAITPAILFALFSKRVTPAGGMAGILVGGLATIVWTLMGTPYGDPVRHCGGACLGDCHSGRQRRDPVQRSQAVSGSPVPGQLIPSGAEEMIFCPAFSVRSRARTERKVRNHMEDPRIRKFAQFLIRSAVELEKGEKILIELHGSETGLMKALVQEAYAVGGKPFVHIFDYAVEGALVQGADAEHMEEIASYELERMRDMDAYIDIRATTNISMWHNVSDEAQKRYRQYYWGPIHLAERCNHTKWSVLRYPNDAMAQLAGVSTEEYEDFYFRACLVDYDKMGRAMQPLQDLMARTDKVRIVAPGTDISFSIKGIPSFGMHGNRNIPDGEIYTSPVKDSVNGHITYNVPSPYDGFLFRDVYLEFRDGKIVKATSNNTDYMNEILDIDEGARYIGEFAFGVNPEINHPIGDILFDEKIAGSFHLTPGNSYDNASNGNHSAVHWDLIQIQTPEYGGGEIWFDDVLIRKDGLFVLDELKCLNPENLLSKEE